VAIPNQDVVYGLGWLSLAQAPVILQVPDFGSRFWTFPVYDARTDEISELGLQYGTKRQSLQQRVQQQRLSRQ
jgi:hypothetical protein